MNLRKPVETDKTKRDANIAKIRSYWDSYLKEQDDVIFYPKMAYRPPGKEELHISLFPSELRKGATIFTEFVNRDFEIESNERSLWKLMYNPHWREEYEMTKPEDPDNTRYLVPVSELIKVTMPELSTKDGKLDTKDPIFKTKFSDLTALDVMAIMFKKPISNNENLNQFIIRTNTL